MTQFSKKTDEIIKSDIKEIKSLAKEIVTRCNSCIEMMKQSYVDNDDWTKQTNEIVACYSRIQYIMEGKRGRF